MDVSLTNELVSKYEATFGLRSIPNIAIRQIVLAAMAAGVLPRAKSVLTNKNRSSQYHATNTRLNHLVRIDAQLRPLYNPIANPSPIVPQSTPVSVKYQAGTLISIEGV